MMIKIFSLSLARSLSLSLRSDNDVMMIKIFSLSLSHARARARALSLSLSLSVSFSLIDVMIMIMKMSALGGECERARGERKIRGEGGGGQPGIVLATRNCGLMYPPARSVWKKFLSIRGESAFSTARRDFQWPTSPKERPEQASSYDGVQSGDYRALQAGHRQDKLFIRRVCMIIGVVARSPAPPAGPPCCGLAGLLCGLPRVGGLLRLPRGLLFRSPAPPAGPPCCGLGGLLRGLPRVGGLLRLPRGLLFRRPLCALVRAMTALCRACPRERARLARPAPRPA